MKKLLSIVLLTTSINFLYSDHKINFFPLKIDGQWHICHEGRNGDEECTPLDLEELKKITKQINRNNQESKKLVHDIIVTSLRQMLLNLNSYYGDMKKQEKKSTAEERNAALEEFNKITPNDDSETCSTPEKLRNFILTGLSREEIESFLSKEEQQMLADVVRMNEEMAKIILKGLNSEEIASLLFETKQKSEN